MRGQLSFVLASLAQNPYLFTRFLRELIDFLLLELHTNHEQHIRAVHRKLTDGRQFI